MAALLTGVLWAGVVVCLLRRLLGQFRAHRPPTGISAADRAARPSVALIVPMRDEIANAAACIAALRGQSGVGERLTILVVDDDSHDGTAAAVVSAAAADRRVRLLSPGPLPMGWMGKPHACWCGALASDAEWLCFVDADVRASPDLVAAALAEAQAGHLDMLSLAPFQQLVGFWERLVLPAGLLLIACVTDLRRAGDPVTGNVAVNGQFLMIRRAVYFAAGGHAAVRCEVCEDKALALRVLRGGWRYAFRDASHLARTRMYHDLPSLWSGFAKNAVDILGSTSATLAAVVAAWIIGWGTWLIPLLATFAQPAAAAWPARLGVVLCAVASLTVLAVHVATARYFRIPFWLGLLFPLGYTAVAVLAAHSVMLRRAGRVSWKGRTYQLGGRAAPGGR